MHFVKQCLLCLVGILILEAVFVHGINTKPAFMDALRETAVTEYHKKLPPFENFDVDQKLAIHRKLLAPTSSDICTWDANEERCRRDLHQISRLMSSSEDTFVKYSANEPLCVGTDDKDSCVNKDQCYWNSAGGNCAFLDFAYGNKDSPCVKAAPATFDEYEAHVICQQQTTSTECAATKNCRWMSNGTCTMDYTKVYFGISATAFFDENGEIYDSKSDELFDLFLEEFNVTAANFEWSEVLEWDVPDTSCPKGATPTVCKYSNAWAKVFAPVALYCGPTYESQPSSCNRDPQCLYSTTRDSCGPSTYTRTLAHARGIIAAAGDLKNEADRDLLIAHYHCTSARKQSDCTGECRWAASTGTCSLSLAYEGQVVAAPAVDNVQAKADPVCMLFEQYAESGCEETTIRFFCEGKRLCSWSSRIGCRTSFLNIIRVALDSTTDTSVTLDAVFPDCNAIRSKSQCT